MFANVTHVTIRICCTRFDDTYTYMYTLNYHAILEYVCSTLFSFPEDGTWPKYWNIDDNVLQVEFDCSLRPRRVVF